MYGVIPPPFVLKVYTVHLFNDSRCNTRSFVAGNLRCGSAQRGYHPWVLCGFFFLFNNMSILIVVEI